MQEKDGLTIDLAEKQHNLKIKIAQTSALRLINRIRVDENVEEWIQLNELCSIVNN